MCITSIDLESEGLALFYNFHSTELKHYCEFRLFFKHDVEIPSVLTETQMKKLEQIL